MVKTVAAMALASLLGVGASGCASDADPGKKLVDRMCACRDLTCILAVDRDAEAYGKSLLRGYKFKRDVPEATIRRLDEMQRPLGACREEVRNRLAEQPPR